MMARSRRLNRRTTRIEPRLSHWRSDGTVKVRYVSEADANRAALGYRLEHGQDLDAYRCEFCAGWHLGGFAR